MTRFVVALPSEARPVARYYGLRKEPKHSAFPVYASAEHSLIVSGIGKAAAAAAVGYLHLAIPGRPAEPWLNYGIAGHAHRAQGEAIRAHKIEDADSRQSWFPPLVCSCNAESDTVRTVSVMESRFADRCAYDMEASGFYPTAVRFSTSEIVQSLKIVSDGPEAGSADVIDKNVVAQLVESRIDLIVDLVGELEGLAASVRSELGDPPRYQETVERWQLTFSQQVQVRTLLQRISARRRGSGLELPDVESVPALLAFLHEVLETSPLGVGLDRAGEAVE